MFAAIARLLNAFWKLSTFRLAPQDIPRSSALLVVATLFNGILSTLINQIQLDFSAAILVAALEMGVLVGLTAALLFYVSHMPRLTQTVTALMGSGALIGAIVLVMLTNLPQLPESIRIVVFLWNLLIMAHILRHALGVHFIAGFFIALGYAVLLIQLIVFVGRSLASGVA